MLFWCEAVHLPQRYFTSRCQTADPHLSCGSWACQWGLSFRIVPAFVVLRSHLLTDSSSDCGLSSTEQAWCQTLPDISWLSRLLPSPAWFITSHRRQGLLWEYRSLRGPFLEKTVYLVPYSYLYICIFSFSEKLPAALFWLHIRLTLSKF